jgi:hypothetical protein
MAIHHLAMDESQLKAEIAKAVRKHYLGLSNNQSAQQ